MPAFSAFSHSASAYKPPPYASNSFSAAIASSIVPTVRGQPYQQTNHPLYTTLSTVVPGPTTTTHLQASTSNTTGKTAANSSNTRSSSPNRDKHGHGRKDESLIRRENNDTSTSASGSASGNSTTNEEGQRHDNSHGSNTILASFLPYVVAGAVFCTVGGCYGCCKCRENYHRQQRIYESMLNQNFNQAATPLQSLPPYVHHGGPHPNSQGCSGAPPPPYSPRRSSVSGRPVAQGI